MPKLVSACLVVAVAGTVATAPAASAGDAVACTEAYVAALTDEGYLKYHDYPYSVYARQQTQKYLACLG